MASIYDADGGGILSADPPRISNAACTTGNPLLADVDGKVGPCADDPSAMYGWAQDTVDATGKDVTVVPATPSKRWVLPIKSTVYDTQASGATAPTPGVTKLTAMGATLAASIGSACGLDLTSGVYSADVGTAGNALLQIVNFRYNWATAKWEAVVRIDPTKSQASNVAV